VQATPRLTDARILVVDDERVNVVLLERILDQDGYRNVKSVTDPSEAVALFDQFDPTWSCSTSTCPTCRARRCCGGSGPRPARRMSRW
jgi:PleD family two-component response regulator